MVRFPEIVDCWFTQVMFFFHLSPGNNNSLNIHLWTLWSCCLITPNLTLYRKSFLSLFERWIFSKISFPESFSTLLSQVNRRDGEMVLGGAGMVRAVKYSPKPFHSHPTDKMQKNGKNWQMSPGLVGGLSQGFHNLGICWSAFSRAGNLVIRQKFSWMEYFF